MAPTLKQFEEEIQRYKAMEKAMRALPVCKSVGWARVDAKPLKKALEGLVAKWSYLFIRYLQDKVTTEMDSLYAFMGAADGVLGLAVGREAGAAEEDADDAAAAAEGEAEGEGGEGVDPAARRAAEEAEARPPLLHLPPRALTGMSVC